MKCKELQIFDWVQDHNGFQCQIIGVGDDYAYATFEDNDGDPWEFDDKDDQPEGIPLTKEILDANGFRYEEDNGPFYRSILGSHYYMSEYCVCVECRETSEGSKICYIECAKNNDGRREKIVCVMDALFVHTLQQALRLVGLSEIADNFKI